MTRGIVYLVWRGECDPSAALVRSLASIKHWHPELPHYIVEMPEGSNLLCKSQMYDLSPFDETLFLDADTTVMGKLDYGFIKAIQHSIALCISANPWNRRYHKIEQHPDEVEYSSGVVFFDKTHPRVGEVFHRWDESTADSSARYLADGGVKEQTCNDQALLTLAMQFTGFNPFVLPQNWNFHPRWQKTFFGPIKIHHGTDDIPASLVEWNAEQSRPGAIIRMAEMA